jgi:AraC family transcriptional regulator, regulatory protein of adaptative response / DNA-3-methyladenine glycosylase II
MISMRPASTTAPTPATVAVPVSPHADDYGYYLALKARDARFDGHFFTGVVSTGVYCRPVCKVRTPKLANCRFFALAAQAEAAGFRPCMRCRPELAPSTSANPFDAIAPWSLQDSSSILARQAARLLDKAHTGHDGAASITQLAQRLGVSDRHLRRIFEAQWGVSPLQYLQTRRLLSAKQLLTDTRLPVTQIATLSGYASVRRFNAVFVEHYRMQPTALRKAVLAPRPPQGQALAAQAIMLKAAYRPPYDASAMLAFFAARSLANVEMVDITGQCITRTVALHHGTQHYTGWVQAKFMSERCEVVLLISESLADVLPTVLVLLKDLLDLDADPQAIHAVLGACFPHTSGARVPGTVDGFELAVRAILGQQVTVRAACTLASRLVERFGAPISTPFAPLTRMFPSAHSLAAVSESELDALGIVRQRQQAIVALAQAVATGALCLRSGADVPTTMAALQALPGIGAWTAHYIAMRALRWPDAFPAGDVALHKALGVQDAKHPAKEAELASQAWRPWRSYAVMCAWATLTPTASPTITAPTSTSPSP